MSIGNFYRQAQKISVRPSILDRVVSYIDPVRGLERLKANTLMAMSGAYTGASKGRRQTSQWAPGNGDADADTLFDLPELRQRSRDLARNNSLASGALNTKVTNIIGTGLRLHSQIDADRLGMTPEEARAWQKKAESEFRLWAENADCDIERTLNFYGLQELAFRQVLENGDAFILMPFKPVSTLPYELRLQIIEADRVSNPSRQADSMTLAGGVEKDVDGAPVRYHFSNRHPGTMKTGMPALEWKAIDAFGTNSGRRNVLHLYHKLRAGQTRGIPDLAPVIETFKQLGQYTEAEIMAAVVSGMFAVFVETENATGVAAQDPTTDTGALTTDKDYKITPGAMIDLKPGEKIHTTQPGRPNMNYDPFMTAILRQIGVSLELPYEVLVKHFTASYSAARAAMLEAWKYFSNRRVWMATYFCQPVYAAFIEEAVATGRLSAPGFFRDPAVRKAYLGSQWVGPAPGMIDELKEVKAAQERIAARLSNQQIECSRLGVDWEVVQDQRVVELKSAKDSGLDALDATSPMPGLPGQEPGSPTEQPTQDPEDGSDKETPDNASKPAK